MIMGLAAVHLIFVLLVSSSVASQTGERRIQGIDEHMAISQTSGSSVQMETDTGSSDSVVHELERLADDSMQKVASKSGIFSHWLHNKLHRKRTMVHNPSYSDSSLITTTRDMLNDANNSPEMATKESHSSFTREIAMEATQASINARKDQRRIRSTQSTGDSSHYTMLLEEAFPRGILSLVDRQAWQVDNGNHGHPTKRHDAPIAVTLNGDIMGTNIINAPIDNSNMASELAKKDGYIAITESTRGIRNMPSKSDSVTMTTTTNLVWGNVGFNGLDSGKTNSEENMLQDAHRGDISEHTVADRLPAAMGDMPIDDATDEQPTYSDQDVSSRREFAGFLEGLKVLSSIFLVTYYGATSPVKFEAAAKDGIFLSKLMVHSKFEDEDQASGCNEDTIDQNTGTVFDRLHHPQTKIHSSIINDKVPKATNEAHQEDTNAGADKTTFDLNDRNISFSLEAVPDILVALYANDDDNEDGDDITNSDDAGDNRKDSNDDDRDDENSLRLKRLRKKPLNTKFLGGSVFDPLANGLIG